MVVAAYDVETGAVAVGKSGPLAGGVNPQVNSVAQKVGGVGAKNPGCAPVGNCAEFKAANTLAQQGSNLKKVKFTQPVRPRTGEPRTMCANCEVMFPR